MKRAIVVLAMVGLSACLPDKKAAQGPKPADATPPVAQTVPASAPSKFHLAPKWSDMPEGPFGDAVRRGAEIFRNTPKHAGKFVGNSQSCQNCHIDGGRQGDAGPMWAAGGMYPAYRKKNGRVNTMEERLQGCFTFSMNAQASEHGAAPPPQDPVLVDLEAYIFWLSQGVPIGKEMAGRGYPALQKPTHVSAERGATVFAQQCAVCHGEDGGGRILPDGTVQFPPLWGPEAYNWGAGMHRNNTAAGFIKANMPLGKADLSDQDAWDVSAYINSKPRPKDPRQTGSVGEADAQFHDEDCQYGDTHEGTMLGTGVARAR